MAFAKSWQPWGWRDVEIRAVVRTGDTTQSERAGMRRRAPAHRGDHARVAVYIDSARNPAATMLSTCRTVIVDEIHAIAGNKRGAHLALSLERLAVLDRARVARQGLAGLDPRWVVGDAKADRGSRPDS